MTLMAYSNFTLARLKSDFGVSITDQYSLFRDVKELAPTDVLRTELAFKLPLALKLGTEKARSELIIAPVLVDLLRQHPGRMSLFLGIEFSVDPARALNGVCDYLISRSPSQLLVEDPVAAIVEAKREDIIGGIAQCLAEMLAAQIFNRAAGRPEESVFGAVTSGSEWRFLHLEGTVVKVDSDEYSITQLSKILGILAHMLNLPPTAAQ